MADEAITDGYTTNPSTTDDDIDIFVTFACKDPMVAKFYRNEFGEQLRARLKKMAHTLLDDMRAEAHTQEHWDYDVIDGRRVPRRDADGAALLLTPTVKVSMMINGRRDNDRDV
jgi:hypothetical protein